MTPRNEANAIIGTFGMHLGTVYEALREYAEERFREARREALEEAAKIADHESGEYKANGEKCDRSGNHVGGTMDCASALACERVAKAIRDLIAEKQP